MVFHPACTIESSGEFQSIDPWAPSPETLIQRFWGGAQASMFSKYPYQASTVENHFSHLQSAVGNRKHPKDHHVLPFLNSLLFLGWMSRVFGICGLVPHDSRTTGGALHSLRRWISTDFVRCKNPITLLRSGTTVSSSQSVLGAVLLCFLWVTAFRHNNTLIGRNAREPQWQPPFTHLLLQQRWLSLTSHDRWHSVISTECFSLTSRLQPSRALQLGRESGVRERTSERGITPKVHRLSSTAEHGCFLRGGNQLHILSTNSTYQAVCLSCLLKESLFHQEVTISIPFFERGNQDSWKANVFLTINQYSLGLELKQGWL